MPLDFYQRRLEIDYGGTWVRLNLFSKNKKTLSFKAPSPPLFKLPSLIKQRLKKWKITQLDLLSIGAKGVWKKNKKKALASKLKKLSRKVTVLSDVEMAYGSTFGDKPGIILIAGTGSIAYGKDGKGHCARAGGLGPKKGDEGSGYWIGKEYLKRTEKWGQLPADNCPHFSVREVASLAKGVLKKAEKGNPLALEIVSEAQQHLNHLISTVATKLHLKKFPLQLHGGLFQNQFLKNAVTENYLECLGG